MRVKLPALVTTQHVFVIYQYRPGVHDDTAFFTLEKGTSLIVLSMEYVDIALYCVKCIFDGHIITSYFMPSTLAWACGIDS